MSELTATNCGCGCDNGCGNGCGNGMNSCLWIILLLICCGGCGNGFGCNNGCGGDNSCLWIILLLICCGGCGNGLGLNNGCGNGCGCNRVADADSFDFLKHFCFFIISITFARGDFFTPSFFYHIHFLRITLCISAFC